MKINKQESTTRCAIYARYSSEMQSDNSIDDQIRNCQAFADSQGWLIIEDYIYCDRAVSGKTIVGRPGLQKLVEASERKPSPFEYVLIDDTSRLSRDKVEQATLIRDLREEGIYIYFVSDNIDTQDETTEDVLLPVYGIKDSLYSRDLAKKTQRGMAGQVLKGFNAGGRLFGYRYIRELDPTGAIDRRTNQVRFVGTRVEIDEEEAKVVKMIFSMYASGYGLRSIAMHLNEKEIAPPRASTQLRRRKTQPTWSPHTIRAILHNSKFFGDWTWNRKQWFRKRKTGKRVYRDRPKADWIEYPNQALAIIDDMTWSSVQERIRENKSRYENGERTPKRNYLLSGLLKCNVCGANLIVVRIRNSTEADYGCSFNWHRGEKACSNNIRIKRSEIEGKIFQVIKEKVLNPGAINRIVKLVNERLKAVATDNGNHVVILRNRIESIEFEIENLIRYVAQSGDTSTHVKDAIAEKEAILGKMQSKLDQTKSNSSPTRLSVDSRFVANWIQKLGELVEFDVLKARSGIERLIGILMATPVTQNGTPGLLLTGKPKLSGILGLVGGGSTLIGSGGRI